jgi:hypothetical protein
MSENEEPDWPAELAKGSEALQREAIRLVKAAEKFAATGRAQPITQRIVRAVSAGIRELAAPEPVVRYVTDSDTFTVTESAIVVVRTIMGSASFALPQISVSGEGTVQQPDLIERNIGRILALVLVAIATSGLLGVQGPARATVDHYVTVIGVALTIAVLIWAGHK